MNRLQKTLRISVIVSAILCVPASTFFVEYLPFMLGFYLTSVILFMTELIIEGRLGILSSRIVTQINDIMKEYPTLSKEMRQKSLNFNIDSRDNIYLDSVEQFMLTLNALAENKEMTEDRLVWLKKRPIRYYLWLRNLRKQADQLKDVLLLWEL